MKGLIAAVLLVSSLASANAQGDLIRVRSGRTFEEEFPPSLRYRFATYQPGKVTYVSGKTAPLRYLNYDRLYEGIICVRITGDTVVLADRPEFKSFDINNVKYIRTAKDKYLEVLEEENGAGLAMRTWFIIKRHDRFVSNGYNMFVENTNSTLNSSNYDSNFGRLAIPKQDLLMAQTFSYFVVDKTGTVYKANKRSFRKVFPQHKAEIDSYLDKNYTDFKSERALRDLFEYCASLTPGK